MTLDQLIIACLLALIFIPWLLTMIVIVKGKTAAIIETFGKPKKNALMPGLRIKAPWPIQVVVAVINLQQQEVSSDVSVKTKDNAFMTLPVKVQYRASDDSSGSVKAHYELENPEQQITSYILNNVRHSVASMDMIELYANRDKMENDVETTLTEQFARYGYNIVNVLVDEPQPSAEVQISFDKVISSKRLKEAAKNEADAHRIRLVETAKAEAESKKLQGEGIAQMREAIAKGMEQSIATMTSSGLSSEQAIAFLNDTNRLDTITTAAAHGNMVLVDTKGDSNIAETIAALHLSRKGIGQSDVD